MRIVGENGVELFEFDPAKGFLKETEILIAHHEAVEPVEEQGHFETLAEYPNGGKDVAWVVDVPGVIGREAYDEFETVLQFIPFTETELKIKAFEKSRQPLSAADVLEMLLPQQINALTVDDNTALRMAQFYPEWTAGAAYTVGFKIQHGGKLWRVLQAHTAQAGWEPESVPALFEQINETRSGTMDDPIPYDGNLALSAGLYYYQGGKLYLCNRDTGNPVYHALSDLAGLYVEEV